MSKFSFDHVKDHFAGWAFLAIIGFGNFQLQKISDGLATLNNQMTQVVTTSAFHTERLDKQWTVVKENSDKINGHEARIQRIEMAMELEKRK